MFSATSSATLRAALIATTLAAGLAGCGGADTVDRGELESQVQSQLSKSVGQEAPKATCPEDLDAEKGAKTRCTLPFEEGTLGVTVTVTSVEDGTAKFSVEADDKIEPS